MAGELTDVGENLALDHLSGNASSITTPLKLALTTTLGSDSAAGTEFSGGSYARQDIVFGAAAAGATSNTNVVTFTDMPAGTLAGLEIWDSSGSPKRIWAMARTGGSIEVSAGSTVTIAAGDVDLSIS